MLRKVDEPFSIVVGDSYFRTYQDEVVFVLDKDDTIVLPTCRLLTSRGIGLCAWNVVAVYTTELT